MCVVCYAALCRSSVVRSAPDYVSCVMLLCVGQASLGVHLTVCVVCYAALCRSSVARSAPDCVCRVLCCFV